MYDTFLCVQKKAVYTHRQSLPVWIISLSHIKGGKWGDTIGIPGNYLLQFSYFGKK